MRISNLVLALLLAGTSAAQANLLVNGDFETQPNFGINGDGSFTRLTGAQLPGWTITDGHSVTVHNSGTYPHISGTYSLNLDGEGANGLNADFYQDFQTVNGQEYNLGFSFFGWNNSANPAPRIFVEILDIVGSNPNGALYAIDFPYTQNTTSGVTSAFIGNGNVARFHVYQTTTGINDNAIIFDDAFVTAVPEPTAVIAAFPALALLRRRRA